jgi:hypothetical protein
VAPGVRVEADPMGRPGIPSRCRPGGSFQVTRAATEAPERGRPPVYRSSTTHRRASPPNLAACARVVRIPTREQWTARTTGRGWDRNPGTTRAPRPFPVTAMGLCREEVVDDDDAWGHRRTARRVTRTEDGSGPAPMVIGDHADADSRPIAGGARRRTASPAGPAARLRGEPASRMRWQRKGCRWNSGSS